MSYKQSVQSVGRAAMGLLLTGCATSAFAQTGAQAPTPEAAPAASQQSAPGTTGLAEIVVTAQRRSENLQQVPIAATVLNGAALSNRGVTSVNDLQKVAPSIVIDSVDRSTFINIRGVGMAQISPASTSGVAYYEDGISVPQFLIPFTFFDVGSVEVLRGPQGTLSGQSSTGGAIYMRSVEPQFGHTSGYVDLTAGNYSRANAAAAVNFGLGDNIAVRAAYNHQQRDSFTKNIGGPRQPGNEDVDEGRLAIAIRSSDDKLKLTLRGEAYRSSNDGVAMKNLRDTNTDPYVIEQDGLTYMKQHGYRLSAELKYAVTNGIDFRGVVSHENGKIEDVDDGDRTATAPGTIAPIRTDITSTSAEVNFLSSGHGPVKWVVGAYYLDLGVPVNIYVQPGPAANFSLAPYIAVDPESKSRSIFGQVNWFITEPLEVYAGLRWNWDKQNFTVSALPGVPAAALPFNGTVSSSEPTGKVGVNYHIDSRSMVYVSASKGYKAGGNNIPPGAALAYRPEKNYVYEAGLKSELFDRKLRLNGDVYYSNYKGVQLQSTVGLPLTQNAANAHSYGAELEAQTQLGNFGSSVGVAYLHSVFAGAACVTNNNGANLGGVNCPVGNEVVPDGQVMPFAPKWTLNGEVHYDLDLGHGNKLTPRLTYTHIDSENSTAFSGFGSTVPGRNIVNARVSLAMDKGWLIEAFADNLFDSHYISYMRQQGVGTQGGVVYGAPRTVGVRAKINFGS